MRTNFRQTLTKLNFFVLLLFILFPSHVFALTSKDRHSLNYQTEYFNEGDDGLPTTCDSNSSDSGPLVGADNIEKAFHYFVDKGLTPIQSAGILGNLRQESGVNPLSQQDGSSGVTPKDGVGFGIAQWTYTDRQAPLVALAQARNTPVGSLGVQLDYVWKEMSTNRGSTLPDIKKATTVEDAATIFEKDFEGAGKPVMANRIKYANEVLARYGASVGADPTTLNSSSSGCATSNGQDTTFVDGFSIYSQYDPAWKDKPYGSSTIGESGCGPSALAMIITALTGKKVTPDETAEYGAKNGTFVEGAGSSWTVAPVLAAHYGLKATAIGANIIKINATLNAGGLVATAGQGAKPFTSGGHYIVIRAVTASGMWKVGDSGHRDTSDKEWNPQQLLTEMHDGSVYAITK